MKNYDQRDLPLLFDALKPFISPMIESSFSQFSGGQGSSAASVLTHGIDSAYHEGIFNPAQAPSFFMLDGSRTITGQIVVATVSAVPPFSLSAANQNQLVVGLRADSLNKQVIAGNGLTGGGTLTANATLNVGAGTLVTVGADTVGLSNGTVQYQIPVTGSTPFAPAYTLLSSFAGNGLTFTTSFNVVVSGLGLSVTADLLTLTSSNNPGAAASILASNAAGQLTLNNSGSTLVPALIIGDGSTGRMAIGSSGWRDNGSAMELLGTRNLLVSTSLITPLWTNDTILTINSNEGTDISQIDLKINGATISRISNVGIGSVPYVSQTTGWNVTVGGNADFRYLFTDELHAKSFIVDLEQALAGGQIVTKSVAILAVNFTAPAAAGTATLRVRDLPSAANMAAFQSGDIVRLRNFSRASGALTVTDCWGVVTAYADQTDGTQTWTFTRSSAPNAGGMATGATVNADSVVLDYGTTGNGFYEVNAIDGTYGANSPYAQIATWTTHPATGTVVRGRYGKLSGLSIGVANEFGIAVGNGFTTSNSYVKYSNVGAIQNNVTSNWTESGATFVSINATDGIEIIAPDNATDGKRAYTFKNSGGVEFAGVYAFSLPGVNINYIYTSISQTNKNAYITSLASASSSSYTAKNTVEADNVNFSAKISVIADTAGSVDITADTKILLFSPYLLFDNATNDGIKFTTTWSNYPSTLSSNGSEISNDTGAYKALLLAGNKSNDASTRMVNIYDHLFVGSRIKVGNTSFVADNLTTFLGQAISTASSISLANTGHGHAAHIGFNTYMANASGSYSASGAWKFYGSQYTGGVTGAGRITWDGNSNLFIFSQSEIGLANEAAITTWTNSLSVSNDTFTWMPSTDNFATIARAKIGYVGFANHAGFAHASAGINYAMIQDSSGATLINSASGQKTRHRINNADVMNLSASGLRIGDGTNATMLLDVTLSDAATTSTTNVVNLQHISSATPGVGFGVGIRAGLKSTTTENREAGRILWRWDVATDATRASNVLFSTNYAGTEQEVMVYAGASGGPKLRFLGGGTPIQRQTIAGSRGGNAALTSLLTALASFGLIVDSSTA